MHLSIISLAALTSAPLALAQIPDAPVAPSLPATVPAVGPTTLATLPAVLPPTLPTTIPASLPNIFAYPVKQILPVPGWNTTTESFDTLASLYVRSSRQVAAQLVAIGR